MNVNELVAKMPDVCIGLGKRGKYKVVVPTDNADGDIDEIIEVPIKDVIWDDAEQRFILIW